MTIQGATAYASHAGASRTRRHREDGALILMWLYNSSYSMREAKPTRSTLRRTEKPHKW